MGKPIPGIEKAKLKQFPQSQFECMFGEAYTYMGGGANSKWYDIYNLIEEAITGKGQGKCRFDFDKGILNCEMNVARNTATKSEQEQKEQVPVMDAVKFDVEIFESRVWKNRYLELEEKEEILEKNIHRIFIVRISRIEGDPLVFTKLRTALCLLIAPRSSKVYQIGREN